MELKEWIRKYSDINISKITVEEIPGTEPLKQYGVMINGTFEGIDVVMTYTTTRLENESDLNDSVSRMQRYSGLLQEASAETDINADVKSKIEAIVGGP